MAKEPRNGASLSKATYDHKRPRFNPPSPDRVQAERAQREMDAAKSRAFHKKVNEFGLLHALDPDKYLPKERIKRRM